MKHFVWLALICASAVCAKAPTALFYLMGTPKSMRSFVAHVDKIDLRPRWFP